MSSSSKKMVVMVKWRRGGRSLAASLASSSSSTVRRRVVRGRRGRSWGRGGGCLRPRVCGGLQKPLPAPTAARGRRSGPLWAVGAAGVAQAAAGAGQSYGSTLSTPLACVASRSCATNADAAAFGDEDGGCAGVRRDPSRGWHCEGGARSSNATGAHLPRAEHVEVGELSSADLDGEGHDGASPDRP